VGRAAMRCLGDCDGARGQPGGTVPPASRNR
jgi:hypothetical protein